MLLSRLVAVTTTSSIDCAIAPDIAKELTNAGASTHKAAFFTAYLVDIGLSLIGIILIVLATYIVT
ncbi:MAG: hypothetical protein AseanaTS_30840 [Candidatus Pelagadaptatus aseana]